MQRVNFVAYACGMRQSGKTTLLTKYASRFPRRIIIDLMGEFLEGGEKYIPGSYGCLSLSEALDTLGDCIGKPAFVVAVCLAPADSVKLLKAVTPDSNPRGGYSLSVDGVSVECGEADTIMPNHKGISVDALALLQRGRHYRCSFLGASLRPADVSRSVTSSADVLAFFKQHEANDIRYLAETAGEALAERVAILEPYAHVCYMPRINRAWAVDPSGARKEFHPLTGADL